MLRIVNQEEERPTSAKKPKPKQKKKSEKFDSQKPPTVFFYFMASHTLELSMKRSNEIDEIFACKKRKKPDPEKTKQPNGDATVKPSKKMKNKKKDKLFKDDDVPGRRKKEKVFKDDDVPGRKKKGKMFKDDDVPGSHSSKPRRNKTNDGLTVYTEEELGINKSDAGGTPLCPFDCECCF